MVEEERDKLERKLHRAQLKLQKSERRVDEARVEAEQMVRQARLDAERLVAKAREKVMYRREKVSRLEHELQNHNGAHEMQPIDQPASTRDESGRQPAHSLSVE